MLFACEGYDWTRVDVPLAWKGYRPYAEEEVDVETFVVRRKGQAIDEGTILVTLDHPSNGSGGHATVDRLRCQVCRLLLMSSLRLTFADSISRGFSFL